MQSFSCQILQKNLRKSHTYQESCLLFNNIQSFKLKDHLWPHTIIMIAR